MKMIYSKKILQFLLVLFCIFCSSNQLYAGVDLNLEHSKRSLRFNLADLLIKNHITIKDHNYFLFLKTIPLTSYEYNSLEMFIIDRRKALEHTNEFELLLHFDPNEISMNDTLNLYFEIDYKGKAHIFNQSSAGNRNILRELPRAFSSKELQDKIDKILMLEAKINSLNRENEINYSNMKFHINVLYSLIGILVAIGLINVVSTLKRKSKK